MLGQIQIDLDVDRNFFRNPGINGDDVRETDLKHVVNRQTDVGLQIKRESEHLVHMNGDILLNSHIGPSFYVNRPFKRDG